MRVGIMGGTFNPPHTGHINAAVSARDALCLSELILIPAGLPPHKKIEKGSATKEQRLEMTRLCAVQIGARVSDVEILREGISYTVDTLREIKKTYPEDELWLIVGTDMFLDIENWRCPDQILKLASLAVVPRKDSDAPKLHEHAKKLIQKYGALCKIIDQSAIPISSSKLRKAITEGDVRRFLPETVMEYIKKNKLYGF